MTETGLLDDGRVLDTLGVEMDVDLYTQTPAAAAGEIGRLGVWSGTTAVAITAGTDRPGIAATADGPATTPASGWRPGGWAWTAARMRTASRTWPAPRRRTWLGCPAGPRRARADPG